MIGRIVSITSSVETQECTGCPVEEGSSCIIVGNGPSVLQNRNGHIIDSFDEVVRINTFKLAGFEQFTGTRTTIWGTFGRDMKPDGETPEKVIFIHGHKSKAAFVTPARVWRVPVAYWKQKRVEIASRSKKEDTSGLIPSTGLIVSLWLAEQGVNLTVTGFDHFSKKQSGLHHYWVNKSYKMPTEHDGEVESMMFREANIKYL